MTAFGRKQTLINSLYTSCRIAREEELKKIDLGQSVSILANVGGNWPPGIALMMGVGISGLLVKKKGSRNEQNI